MSLGHCDTRKTSNGILFRHRSLLPAVICQCILMGNEFQREPMRIEEGKHLLIETSDRACDCYAVFVQTLNPVIERCGWDRERDINNLSCSSATLWRARPGKERHDRTGCTYFIAIVEMIGAGVIKVDGLLDQALPQDTGIKIDILLGISHYSSEMVKTSKYIIIHNFLPGDLSP